MKTPTILLLVLLMPFAPGAQVAEETFTVVTMDEVRTNRSLAESDTGLSDSQRTRILDLYDTATISLEAVELNQIEFDAKNRERLSVTRIGLQLRAALDRPDPEPDLDLPDNPSVEQAEDALARERSRLAANRSALRKIEGLAEERDAARSEISSRLGALDQEIELLTEELQTDASGEGGSELLSANRIATLARRQAAMSEIELLRASLALLEDKNVLQPLQTDQAQRRISFTEHVVFILEELTYDLRHQAARAALEKVREQCRQAAELSPDLAPTAIEIEDLADLLWGEEGIVNQSEGSTRALLETEKNLSDLDRMGQLMRRKFEAFGNRGSITRWWPKIPTEFPGPGDVASTLRRLETEIPEVEHRLISLEEQRSSNRFLATELVKQLRMEYGEEISPEMMVAIRELFATRREVLDDLVQQFSRHSNHLNDQQASSREFLSNLEYLERFLYSQILWARSVPRPIVPRTRDLVAAYQWLTLDDHRRQTAAVGSAGMDEIRDNTLVAILVLALVVLFRRWIAQRMAQLSERTNEPGEDSFALTVEALLHTVLLAAPLPLILYLASGVLASAGSSTFLTSAAFAASHLAAIVALLELVRQLLSPHGLGEGHFNWPARITRPAYQRLAWSEFTATPFLFVALQFAGAGIRLDSPAELQVYNNSLGRVAFVIAMLILGVTVLTLLRLERKEQSAGLAIRSTLSNPFKHFDIPAMVLVAAPLVFVSTIVPALLAATGFYVTALLLAYQMLRTLLLIAVVLVIHGLLYRWQATRRDQAQLEIDGDAKPRSRTGRELAAANRQVEQLFRFFVIIVTSVGLYMVWADALPMLRILERIQVWPRIEMLAVPETRLAEMATAGKVESTTANASSDIDGSSETGTSVSTPMGPMPTGGTDQPASSEGQSNPLTLWILLQATFAAIVTFGMARNVPGFLEFLLKSRTRLDSGARFAFATLGRYVITIVGVSAVFGLLGIGWSKIQWLAAALTFGLGFGLQEIVANFVSGLILLIERPVRVGDVVTIGNLMGTVSQIQIRATTITLWDRSEMIVPNKEFITTKLVNWTLADSRRRIEVPLRIAYGADLDLVKRTLITAAEQNPEVLPEPAPHALLIDFADDAIRVELRFVVDFGKGIKVKDEVQMAIDRAFKEHGIEFALPQLKLSLPGGQDERPVTTDGATENTAK